MRWILAILGLLLVAVAVLAQWPARQVASLAGLARAGAAANAWEGTLWDGRASGFHVRGIRLGELTWKLAPSSVLALRPRVAIVVNGPEISADAAIESNLSGSRIVAEAVTVTAPANWLQHVIQQPFLQLGGNLDAALSSVRFEDGWLVGLSGETIWRNAVVTGRIRAPLGEIRIDWADEANGVVGRVSDAGGPLRVAGAVEIRDRRYTVDVTLDAAPENVQLRQALEVLGRPGEGGTVRLAISGPMVPIR